MKSRIPFSFTWLALTGLAVLFSVGAHSAETLPLAGYLGQVEEKNGGVKAARELSAGARGKSAEGSLLLTPRLFGKFVNVSDEREQPAPDFQGRKTSTKSYSLGVRQSTTFGLDAALSYQVTNTVISGANPQLISQPAYYSASPVLELSQSLWSNFFGASTRARQELLEATQLKTSYDEAYQTKLLRADAEVAYWNLALSRESVRVQRDSLERFERMRDLHRRKTASGLSDRADLLQAVAAAESRRLELANAIDAEKVAARAFNTARGLVADVVPETLEPITTQVIESMRVPEKVELREDVLAAREQERVDVANATIGRETNAPDIRAFATLSLNGRDPALKEAAPESFTAHYPYNTVGVEFSAPLDLEKLSKTREAYAATSRGSKLRYERKLYEQDRQWSDLVLKFDEAKARLSLARAVQASQKEKLDYERGRLGRGRTTTFQVLQFEQDYANSQLAFIQAEASLLQSTAQLKTFGGSQ